MTTVNSVTNDTLGVNGGKLAAVRLVDLMLDLDDADLTPLARWLAIRIARRAGGGSVALTKSELAALAGVSHVTLYRSVLGELLASGIVARDRRDDVPYGYAYRLAPQYCKNGSARAAESPATRAR